jgi:hypothetical protein
LRTASPFGGGDVGGGTVVLLMKRSMLRKGAHVGAELGAPAGIACADEVTERCRLIADIVAKVENRTTPKISQMLIFSQLRHRSIP